MSLPDFPVVAVLWCPTCAPERDPLAEVLDLRYCAQHEPGREGLDDTAESLKVTPYLSGSGEAGGDDNRAWCELLNRKRTLRRGSA